mgnify:CR=1 FL=1
MDEMDKQIFAPLPKSKETEFNESTPKLSEIFDNLQKHSFAHIPNITF